jgi:Tol biopolymer transport system component
LTFPPEDTVLRDAEPAFSPDGKLLAFKRGADSSLGAGDLFVQPAAGGEARRVTVGRADLAGFDWTPDSRALVFSGRGLFGSQLFKVGLDGSAPVPLSWIGEASAPTLAPNRLAFVRSVSDFNIWRVSGPLADEKTPPEKLITSTRTDWMAEYSPDGEHIAFGSARDGEPGIWIADASGKNERRLVASASWTIPRWSPDGEEIAYTAAVGSENHDVFVTRLRGGPPRRLTSSDAVNLHPTWSPDGEWIFFHSLRNGVWEIWRVPSEGGDTTQISRGGGQMPLAHRDRLYYWWKWNLWSVPLEGGEPIRAVDARFNIWTAWNGKILYVDRRAETGTAIELFDPGTGETREVASLGEWPLLFLGLSVSPDGKWILYTQGDDPGSDIMLVEGFR